ncbi:MAG: hypothetical protein GF344_07245 [Chitinivibrionales bacterium]|nr:hypothetical protein [Chitinivibrionales bacterium]MBD3356706.1 hypothetical protein [Chitinivibrionales bacterium]
MSALSVVFTAVLRGRPVGRKAWCTMREDGSARIGALLFLTLLLSRPSSAETEQPLERYLLLALEHNPRIHAAQGAVEAAGEERRLAGALPDPSVSGGYFISEVETRVGAQRGKVGVSQMIPWPGKSAKKREMAGKAFSAEQEELRRVKAEVVARVRQAYASLYATGQAIRASRESLELLKQWESVLLTDYANAEATQASVLKLQVEMAVAEDGIASLEAEGEKAREELTALVGVDGPLEIPYPRLLPSMRIPKGALERADSVLAASPMVGKMRYLVEEAQANVGLAKRFFAPDFMIMTDYIFTEKSSSSMVSPEENGKDPWVVGASVTVPLWFGTNNSRIRKAREMRRVREKMLESTRDKVGAELAGVVEDYSDAVRRVTLLHEVIVPKARQTLVVVEEAYKNNSVEVLDFLDAQRMLLELEKSLALQEARREKKAAVIDMIIGAEFTRHSFIKAERERGRNER